MAKPTFWGGTHPPESKRLTQNRPIDVLPPPSEVVIPASQHLGAPAEPCVEVGAEVKVGQKIAEATGFVSVPVHATISGQVTKIGPHPHPLGNDLLSIFIQGDGKDEWSPEVMPRSNFRDLIPQELRDIVKEAGLAGMGGATFPTHVKLSPPEDKPIDTFILNGVECEPYLTADHRLMLEHPHEILAGMQIIMRILDCARAIIGIEANKPDAIQLMRSKVEDERGIEVVELPVKYPQGAEKQLIKALTDREVPAGGLPMDVGCLVHNVGTAFAVYEAVVQGKPLVDRVVTVTGSMVKEPKNLKVRIGTLCGRLIEACGGATGTIGKIISGGPMMGIAQYTEDVPVIKGTSGILLLSEAEVSRGRPRPCISCGRCLEACPMRLTPTQIAKLVEHERWSEADLYGVLDCIECGCCAYVCPSKIDLVHLFKYGKARVMAQRKRAG